MTSSVSPLKWLLAFAARLRFPQLFLLTAAIFVLDLFIPDMVPFVDEILLGLVTALIGSWKRKDPEQASGEESPEDDKGNT